MSRVRDLASILTASSSIATDTEVSAVSAQIPANVTGKNFVINGNFDFWQRGTSFAAAGAATTSTYTADRWNSGASNNITIFRVSASTEGSTYALRLQKNTGTSTGGDAFICHTIESNNAVFLAGKTVTLSFNVKKGADFSGSAVYCVPRFGTGLDEGSLAGYNGQWTGYSQAIHTVIPTTIMTRYEKTFTVPSGTKEIMLLMGVQSFPGTAAGANDWVDFEKIQLEVGSVATTFSRAGGDIEGEFAKCQRYYQVPPTAIFLHGYNSSAAGFWWQPPVVMRVAPSASLATTSPYWESVPYTTIGSLTSASLNNTKMTASGGTIVIAGAYSPSPATSYPSLFNGANIAFSAEL